MNLNKNPNARQLRQLLTQFDDTASHHLLWVKKNGDVVISQITGDPAAASFEEEHPEMQMRLETFLIGNEYVGPEAAADQRWVTELLERLLNEWARAKGKTVVAHINGL